MKRRTARAATGAFFFLLVALHLDFWRPHRAVLYGGWFPEELAYRLFTMLLAFLFIHLLCSRVWEAPD